MTKKTVKTIRDKFFQAAPIMYGVLIICGVLVFGLSSGGPPIYAGHVPEEGLFDKPHCKLGVHVLSPSDEDFVKASELINANGGKHCWITLVLREDEMHVDHVQRIHDLARKHQFQVIHRIEKGFSEGGNWKMPDEQTVQTFIDVMRDVRPANKDVYIVLGNEPTHAAMCGDCTPEEFAQWSMKAVRMLHEADFGLVEVHVGMAGHDLASPQRPPQFYDAGIFMERMFAEEPDLLCEVDMWVSHNYPRNFVGSATSRGRLSPRGYEWELAFAEDQAREDCKEHVRNLPVFITETGYRTAGLGSGFSGIDSVQAYARTQQLIGLYQRDPRVKAVTFFAYRYCGEPFQAFALAGCDVTGFNGVGQALQGVQKTAGDVRHIRRARSRLECPRDLVEQMTVKCLLTVENDGTDIWDSIYEGYDLTAVGASHGSNGARVDFDRFSMVKPGERLKAEILYNPGKKTGQYDITLGLERNGRFILGFSRWTVQVFEAPTLTMNVETFIGNDVDAENAQVQVFNDDQEIVHRETVDVVDGQAVVDKVFGVLFDRCYRVVLLVEGSLPVQKQCVTFEKQGAVEEDGAFTGAGAGGNRLAQEGGADTKNNAGGVDSVGGSFAGGGASVDMPRLLPVDTNNDGKLSLSDILNRFRE